jgi:hypothetical protein
VGTKLKVTGSITGVGQLLIGANSTLEVGDIINCKISFMGQGGHADP